MTGRRIGISAAAAVCIGAASLSGCRGMPVGEAEAAVRARDERRVFHDTFDDGLSRWRAEGPHVVRIVDGRMHVETVDDARKVGQYVWCLAELPADFRAEWDLTPVSTSGFFLVFFCARGVGGGGGGEGEGEGEDVAGDELLEGYMPARSWKAYQDFDKYVSPPNRPTGRRIRCYHVSYRRNESASCNLRKNPGLNLLRSNTIDMVLPAGKTAHVTLSKEDARIRLSVDGVTFMDYLDEGTIEGAPYAGGRIGLRQVYESAGLYDNFEIYDLTGAPASSD